MSLHKRVFNLGIIRHSKMAVHSISDFHQSLLKIKPTPYSCFSPVVRPEYNNSSPDAVINSPLLFHLVSLRPSKSNL
jgi:hypothetical protein